MDALSCNSKPNGVGRDSAAQQHSAIDAGNIVKEHCSLALSCEFLVTACSEGFCSQSGYDQQEVVGKDLCLLLLVDRNGSRSSSSGQIATMSLIQAAVRKKLGFEMTMLCYVKGKYTTNMPTPCAPRNVLRPPLTERMRCFPLP